MALEHIRECETVVIGDKVILTGTDKITGEKVTLSLKKSGFDAWQKGMPISFTFLVLTMEERRFLMTGTKKKL